LHHEEVPEKADKGFVICISMQVAKAAGKTAVK